MTGEEPTFDARPERQPPQEQPTQKLSSQDAETAPAADPGNSRARALLSSTIGHYRILELLGEGGMGTVYEAEQEQPRRTVALKVIKSGFASPELLRRFELESQVLGRLHHPGIAQVYEAGTADTILGRQPYFAMELVRGTSLLIYAAEHHLSTRQRLEMMATICDAVEHAHQSGLIHRDLKPGNILVDDAAQPKILDFGLARLIDSDTQATRQTDVGQVVGTLAYMSPEQALGDPMLLDRRSDVYSLGVILYELLASRLPYPINPVLHVALETIREQDPTPLSSLNRFYRGDIETIVSKAMEKDRNRRYASAADLASDIRRYLRDEPILARPASRAYQVQKFARRHKALVASMASVFLILTSATVVSLFLLRRANQERDGKEKVLEFISSDLLAQASPEGQSKAGAAPDPDIKLRTVIDRAETHVTRRFTKEPELEAEVRATFANVYHDLGLDSASVKQFERVAELHRRTLGPEDRKTLSSMNDLAAVSFYIGDYDRTRTLLDQALPIQRRRFGETPITFSMRNNLAFSYQIQGNYAKVEELHRQTFEARKNALGPSDPATLRSLDNLGFTCYLEGKYAEAETLLTQALDAQRAKSPDGPFTLAYTQHVAMCQTAEGKYDQAEAISLKLLEDRTRVLGADHPDTISVNSSLAWLYQLKGNYAMAEQYGIKTLEGRRHALPRQHPDTLLAEDDLALAYVSEGKFADAEPLAREAFESPAKLHWRHFRAESLLGASLAGQKKYAEAEPKLLEGYRGMLARKETIAVPDRYHLDRAAGWVDQLYQSWGKPDMLSSWRGAQ